MFYENKRKIALCMALITSLSILSACSNALKAKRTHKDAATQTTDDGTKKENLTFNLSLPEDAVVTSDMKIDKIPFVKNDFIQASCSLQEIEDASLNLCGSYLTDVATTTNCMPNDPIIVSPYDDHVVTLVLDLYSAMGQENMRVADFARKPIAHLEFPITCSEREISLSLSSALTNGDYELVADLVYPGRHTRYHGTTGRFTVVNGVSLQPVTLIMSEASQNGIPVDIIFIDNQPVPIDFNNVGYIKYRKFEIREGEGMSCSCGGCAPFGSSEKIITEITVRQNDTLVQIVERRENLANGEISESSRWAGVESSSVHAAFKMVIGSYDKEKEQLACANYYNGSSFEVSFIDKKLVMSLGSCYMNEAKQLFESFLASSIVAVDVTDEIAKEKMSLTDRVCYVE